MKNFLVLFLLPLTAVSQKWLPLQEFPATKRDDGIGVVVNNKAYFGTGLQEWNATIDFMVLDLHTFTWSTIPAMPNTTERQYAVGFTATDCFYIFGGTANAGPLNTLFKYDLNTKSWKEMSPKPGKGLLASALFQFGDKVIVSNGKYGDNTLSSEVWEYEISTDSWKPKNNFPDLSRWRSSYATSGGKGYLLFGIDSAGDLRKELYEYDPGADSWKVIDSFPGPGRAYASMQSFANRLFVFGGMDSVQPYHNDFWSTQIGTGKWHPLPAMPSAGRRGGMSCAAGEKFVYTCGITLLGRLTETWFTDLPTSTIELQKESLDLFPNPFSETLQLVNAAEIEQIDVYLTTGTKIYTQKIDSTTLNLSFLPEGIYLLVAETKNGLYLSKKILRE